MPTFHAVALERLLEPTPAADSNDAKKPLKSPHIFISPALYTTPNPTPVPNSSPSSVSPSPYVVNRKRRGDLPPPPDLRLNGFHVKEEEPPSQVDSSDGEGGASLQDGEEGRDVLEGEIAEGNGRESPENEGDLDEFADPCDSTSVASSCESSGRGSLQQRCVRKHSTPLSIQTEFYDASEDFLSDGSTSLSHSFSANVEAELRDARSCLVEEIEKRKKAEEALVFMHGQWQRIVDRLSQAGLSFPMISESGNVLLETDTTDQFCQEIITARFVSEAVGRGQARAESEAAAQAIIDSKNQEIARLQDKLQYYEAVNHEMSQRNQEIMEMSRKKRQTRLRRKKWIWSCAGLSVALGASILAYSYFPHSGEPPATSNDGSDTS